MKRFAIRMPNTRKTEVRIVGSSGAALNRAAHPVLGARFSRLAALAKVAVFKKGDAECSVQSTYHPGAENGLHWKTVAPTRRRSRVRRLLPKGTGTVPARHFGHAVRPLRGAGPQLSAKRCAQRVPSLRTKPGYNSGFCRSPDASCSPYRCAASTAD